jgi:hypothetical protein
VSQLDHQTAMEVPPSFAVESFPAMPGLECNIVMKGGITSGMIYPLAVRVGSDVSAPLCGRRLSRGHCGCCGGRCRGGPRISGRRERAEHGREICDTAARLLWAIGASRPPHREEGGWEVAAVPPLPAPAAD